MNPSALENRINEYASNGYRVTHFSPIIGAHASGAPRTSFCAVLERTLPEARAAAEASASAVAQAAAA